MFCQSVVDKVCCCKYQGWACSVSPLSTRFVVANIKAGHVLSVRCRQGLLLQISRLGMFCQSVVDKDCCCKYQGWACSVSPLLTRIVVANIKFGMFCQVVADQGLLLQISRLGMFCQSVVDKDCCCKYQVQISSC